MYATSLLALASSASLASAASMGFNWASNGGSQSTFEADFKAQASLPNASGFNSARLYTMIQEGTTNTPISAIQAAIDTKTTLLLGLWASAGQASFDNEIAALKSAISTYGSSFADAVVGISVGSEDLYRDTDTSKITNKDPNPGASPDTLVDYIGQVRDTIKGTSLSGKPVGHVDTYTAYINGSNQALINACDFLGMDAYPYYQTTQENSIENARDLFFSAYDQTSAAGGGKIPVWVTETGWPTSGKTSNLAVASIENAKTYWQQVGCSLFGKTNVWWFTLADSASPSFGIVGNSINGQPLWDLSCEGVVISSSSPSSSKTASSAAATSSATSSATTTGSGSGSSSGSSSTISTATSASTSGAGSGAVGAGSGNGGGSGAGSGPAAGTGSGSASTTAAGGSNGTVTTAPSSSSSTFAGAASRGEISGLTALILGTLAYLL